MGAASRVANCAHERDRSALLVAMIPAMSFVSILRRDTTRRAPPWSRARGCSSIRPRSHSPPCQ
jgi:hypothetical protein